MRKKTLVKVLAIIVCLCILSLNVPNAMAAERDGKRVDLKVLVKKSMEMFCSLFSFMSPVKDNGDSGGSYEKISKPKEGVVITGGGVIVKPPKGGD